MRNAPWLVFPALVLALCVGISSALGAEGDGYALADRALNASGLQSQLEMLPEALLSWLPGDAFPGDKTRKEALQSVRNASEESIRQSVRSALVNDMDANKMGKVLTFYDSKLGRKVARLQAAALSPSLIGTIREGRKATVSQDERRLSIVRRIVRAEEVSAAASALAKRAMRGIFDGAGVNGNRSEEEVKTGSESAEPKYRSAEAGSEEAALMAFSNTFSSLDDKELEEFASFCESDAAAWFRNTVRRGLDEAVYSVGLALGKALNRVPAQAQ